MVTSNRAPSRRDGFPNRVTLNFDILTSIMHAERLLWSTRVPRLVLIVQAVFLLERGHTDRQTRLNALPTPAVMPAWVNNVFRNCKKYSTEAFHVTDNC